MIYDNTHVYADGWSFTEATDTCSNRLNFILLYPGSVGETAEKCKKIAKLRGYNNLVLTYLFSLYGPSPEHILFTEENNRQEKNDSAIYKHAETSAKVVLAWGGYGVHKNRGAQVVKLLEPFADKLYVLGYTKTGQPAHPSKIKYTQELIKYGC